jgi:hypothetical protein
LAWKYGNFMGGTLANCGKIAAFAQAGNSAAQRAGRRRNQV